MRAIIVSLLLLSGSVFAADRTPVGIWKTIDDDTHVYRIEFHAVNAEH